MSNAESVRVYLGIGSNLEPREQYMRKAVDELAASNAVQIARISSVYESEPWGKHDQPQYLNAVVECESLLDPQHLMELLKSIESNMGRVRTEKYGPRIIDLDILLYGAEIIHSEGLRIPHPQIRMRRFVLVPLAELAPDLRHPELGITVLELSAVCPDMGRIWKLAFSLA